MKTRSSCAFHLVLGSIVGLITLSAPGRQAGETLPRAVRDEAAGILLRAGNHPGLTVHAECGDGVLTAALGVVSGTSVHGVTSARDALASVRQTIARFGVYGRVAVDAWDGVHLPYGDDMVNLVILAEDRPDVRREAMRVLAPLGVLLVREGDAWHRQTKRWPDDIDEWTHYLHGPGNNAVADDTRIGPPASLQWIGSPRWARHHDRLASMSALVSAGNRLFYIFDEGPTASIVLPSTWSLIARDAFNGMILWKQPIPEWQTRFWPLKSGPAQLPRRLVATRERVFVTLGIDVPVTALHAATGEVIREYADTRGTVEILQHEGVLYLLVDPALDREKYTQARRVNTPWWAGETQRLMAVNVESGTAYWSREASVAPLSLGLADGRLFFHNGETIVCLDAGTGSPRWESEPVPLVRRVMSFFAPTLVARDPVVLFAGGEESGLVKSTGGATKADTLTALDANTGRILWTAAHPPSGYSSPEDLFVIGDTVWFAQTSNGRLPGQVTGLDLRTGKVRRQYDQANVDTYWFHHRCYRGKASSRYLMVSRTGIEFIDAATGHWDINHWVRGGCLYGFMPANGLLYAPPHACACYPETKLSGFCALASRRPDSSRERQSSERLHHGPAFGWRAAETVSGTTAADWPTYRGGSSRGAATSVPIEKALACLWSTPVGGTLSAVTVAYGKAFVADIDAHAVVAVDADSGHEHWRFIAGGRVDSPPTAYAGTAIFGCADGHVYCLRAADGVLVWRFRAAPGDQRIAAFEQLESRWPVHGSVLIENDTLYVVAGRSLFLDGGLRLYRLDPRTGALLGETTMDERDPATGEELHTHVQRLTMPVALPDVLSSDGAHLFMRSQVFDMNGARQRLEPFGATRLGAHAAVQEGPTQHLFSSSGFLDGSWFHRAYWLYGRSFEGGWNSYYLAGKNVAAGKILAFDEQNVYGFGRQPRYFRWTTPMEYQLFAVPKDRQRIARKPETDAGSVIRVEKSASLDPTGTALLVSAWAAVETPGGVLIAHGGGVLGYALFVRERKACFAVTDRSRRAEVVAGQVLPAGWVHLAGILRGNGEMRLYVNGDLAATGQAPALISGTPANAMQIGADEDSAVGTYRDGLPFKGDIDDVRVYHGEFQDEAVKALFEGGNPALPRGASLVLHMPFDDGSATDLSAHRNHGQVIGAMPVDGRWGKALRFAGILPGAPPPTSVNYAWAYASPILVRGLAVAGSRMLVAGPEDILDEPDAVRRPDDAEMAEQIIRQRDIFQGKAGGKLLVLNAADGVLLQSLDTESIPVWDGLAAAAGRLYMAAADGTLRCFAGQ